MDCALVNYIFVSLVLASVILFILILRSKSSNSISGTSQNIKIPQKQKKPCPICGTMLEYGEKVTSHEYRGVSSSVVHVFGCPHCYGEKSHLPRVCPVCKQDMNSDNYLMGIMIRGEKKIHLKIKGCITCAGK